VASNDDLTATVSQLEESAEGGDGDRELPRLIVAFECRRPLVPALRLSMVRLDELHVGRGPARIATRTGRQLELQLGDHEISRRHLQLQRRDGAWELTDLGSKNGTIVNGAPAPRAILVDGDLIEVGGAMLLYRDEGRGHHDVTDLDMAETAPLPAALRTVSLELEARVRDLMKIAPSAAPVLIRGETGTGKELTARAIHELSRRSGAFVPVNCGALPRTLVESELFGSKRGAFSGALEHREGLVRRADGGTLFLDEIAELPDESQVALLRVLQEGEVRPIGATDAVHVDVRVVAATHQDLEARIAEGRFRRDLYARLVGYVVTLPPLRGRREDIGTLIATMLGRLVDDAPTLTVQRLAARALLTYPYPLNSRELEQALRAAVALADGGEIRLEHLPEAIRTYRPPGGELRPEDQALRDRLTELLRDQQGNVSAVARSLGKAPIQLRRWCRRFGIDISSFRPAAAAKGKKG
jgi:transcriptional regulator with AAA-type ATPase domain